MTHTTHPCQYIGGHGHTPTCGHAALPGLSYCGEHLAVVYQKGTARARRKKDERVAATVWSVVDSFNEAVAELEAEGYDFGEEQWDVREVESE